MNHATDGLLQAYHDGEVEGPALAELRDHLAVCTLCTQELASLRMLSGEVSSALALIDVEPPQLDLSSLPVPIEAARARRSGLAKLGSISLAKAAMLLLAFTGALAAIPGTPLRRAVEAALTRLFESPQQTVDVAPVEEAPVPDVRDIRILPSDGRVRVLVHGPETLEVTVALTAGDYAEVERSTIGQDVAWRLGTGRLEITGLRRGSLRIALPRAAEHATVEIDGKVYVYKANGMLHLSGPAGRGQGDEVTFRIGQ